MLLSLFLKSKRFIFKSFFLTLYSSLLSVFNLSLIFPLLSFLSNQTLLTFPGLNLDNLTRHELVVFLMMLFILINFASIMVNHFQVLSMQFLSIQIMSDMRMFLVEKLLNVKLTELRKMTSQTLSHWFNSEIAKIGSLTNLTIRIALNVLLILFSLVLLLIVNTTLTLSMLVLGLLYTLIVLKVLPTFKTKALINLNSAQSLNTWLMNILKSIKDIRIFNSQSYFLIEFEKSLKNNKDNYHKFFVFQQWYETFIKLTGLLLVALSVYFFVIVLNEPLESIITSLIILLRLWSPSTLLMKEVTEWHSAYVISLKFIEEINNLKPTESLQKYPQTLDTLSIDSCTIIYQDQHILSAKDITIEKNKIIGIIGPSGSGKSSLVHALLGFVDTPISLRLNGKEFNQSDVLDLATMVSDESSLLPISIKDNLQWFTQSSEEQIMKACKMANIHDDIMNLPHQYETIINEASTNISSGQRQRILLARALLSQSQILILDEATNHLDSESETLFFETCLSLKHELAMIVISHKESLQQYMDEIYVIHHQHLKQKNGL
jgi:ABC-type bacteriocin/lantibiotic exporter with double-glycine peptidase domain